MDNLKDQWKNELMDEEDQLIEEMNNEFAERLQKRLQKKVEKKEQEMAEVRELKKKDPPVSV